MQNFKKSSKKIESAREHIEIRQSFLRRNKDEYEKLRIEAIQKIEISLTFSTRGQESTL
jgi:hypothetical protein